MAECIEHTYQDRTSFSTANPFKIAAEIRRLVGEIEAAPPTASGKLINKTNDKHQAEVLLKQDS